MGRYQEGHLVKRFGGWHVRYYVTENGARKQKSHRLCDDQQKKSHVKQLCDEFMRTQVNIGVENAVRWGWLNFGTKFICPSSSQQQPQAFHRSWLQAGVASTPEITLPQR